MRYYLLECRRLGSGFVIRYQLFIFHCSFSQGAFISLTRHASAMGCVPYNWSRVECSVRGCFGWLAETLLQNGKDTIAQR